MAARHILIVDDHEDCRDMLATFLRLLGHDVQCAADGPSALQAANARTPDVIFLDISMPGMDGCTLCKHLRARAATRNVPIYALTASCDIEPLNAHGITGVFEKPIDLEEIAAVLRSDTMLPGRAIRARSSGTPRACRSSPTTYPSAL